MKFEKWKRRDIGKVNIISINEILTTTKKEFKRHRLVIIQVLKGIEFRWVQLISNRTEANVAIGQFEVDVIKMQFLTLNCFLYTHDRSFISYFYSFFIRIHWKTEYNFTLCTM